jgi:glycine betaine/proline transport system permease protein
MSPFMELVKTAKLPIGIWGKAFFDFLTTQFAWFFNSIASSIAWVLDTTIAFLIWLPPEIVMLVFGLLALYLQRSWKLAISVIVGMLFIANQGLWRESIETIVLVATSAATAMAIGVPIGIWVSHRPHLYRYIQPVLDSMQTLPTFVYLVPVLILFGLGLAPGLVVTVIFALPTPIRLTYLGMVNVPTSIREAGLAFGATKNQLLWKVELPAARATIMAGLSQCIMLCLSMVVFAALIGAKGLGTPVVRARSTR